MPVSAPVVVLKFAHAGLPVMLKVSVPPFGLVVVGVKLYAWLTMTEVGGVPEIVTAGAEATVIVNAGSAAVRVPSDTLMTMPPDTPVTVGVPLSWPVVALNVAHDGLLVIENVSVPEPPVAVGWKLYALPTVAVVAGVPEIVSDTVALTVTVAEPDFVLSATEIAVIVTVSCAGTVAGAVYSPPDVIVPTVALPPVTPLTCQVTEVSVALATVAVNCCVPEPACRVTVAGETVTETGCAGAVIVRSAEPDTVLSATDTAVIITVAGDGTVPGEE